MKFPKRECQLVTDELITDAFQLMKYTDDNTNTSPKTVINSSVLRVIKHLKCRY